ncbi:CGH_1_HP_G0099370.mRNA.1.CDS.1 [Saccharomyces cerevisiae]|nr:CGH_1_HP_G0099370.mRNA.1.CDS.1 [Saccharomyces cerevisiae]CAI6946154.1 CGH_1_HP_G0099370.mRNA.1.CDS.1 [Saccharomyces cerevisiae]
MFIRSVHSGRTLLLVSSVHVLQQAACLVDYSGLIVTEDPNQWPWVFYAFGIATFLSLLMAWYSIPKQRSHKYSWAFDGLTGSRLPLSG